jgi:hypothetical protein
LRRALAVLVTSTAFALVGTPAATAGSGNPSGTGPPNQNCQSLESGFGNALPSMGAGTSPGSVFNEQGVDGSAGGTGGNTYNAVGAPSQYDVACSKTLFKLN